MSRDHSKNKHGTCTGASSDTHMLRILNAFKKNHEFSDGRLSRIDFYPDLEDFNPDWEAKKK
jgi:hypothetical protein